MSNSGSPDHTDRPSGPGGVFGRIVGSVVSPIVGNIDLDEVIDQIDVNEAIDRVDVNQLVDRIDVDRLVERIDLDEVVARVDLNRAIEGVDVNQLLDRIDPDQLLDRIDADGLLDRIDPDRLLDRIDPDRLLDRVDPDRLLDRVDPDRLLERVDVNQLVARTELGEIIARSTTGVFSELLDVARTQVIITDQVAQGVPARMLGRPARQLPPHPGGSEEPAGSADLSPTDRAVQMQGRFAGSVSRFLPFLADQFVIGVFFAIGALLVQSAIRVVFQTSFDIEDSGAVMVIAFVLWAFLYTAGSLAATGRTIGKAILGLMAVRSDGSKLDARHAALRTLMFPLSFVLFGIGFLIGLVRRDRRELHDLIADTAIVYAWEADTARLRLEASTQGAHAGAATLRR
ncbi:RDD family protein [Ilumatobacter sp.]|uniref:RDD family protein n=2 Tax=Ilumatobacter TaxID=682522 RepID=UPI002A283398|nr:RDD family protein [Ilumatobacter sp.]